jgi:hypothetical protein
VALQGHWSNSSEWYRSNEANDIWILYQCELDRLSKSDNVFRDLIVHCQQCHIPFLTSATNQGRKDLRCPMGCRENHRKTQSKKRSTAYYQDEPGKQKKKEQNDKRKGRLSPCHSGSTQTAPQVRQMKKYLQFLFQLIEHRTVRPTEINEIYDRIQTQLRQHPFEKIRN